LIGGPWLASLAFFPPVARLAPPKTVARVAMASYFKKNTLATNRRESAERAIACRQLEEFSVPTGRGAPYPVGANLAAEDVVHNNHLCGIEDGEANG
jgi:hypothetical protein